MYIIIFIIGLFSYSLSAQTLNDSDRVDHLSVEEQIFEQLGTLTLLEIAPLNRGELIERLEQDLNIHVRSNDIDLFDRYFLSYIYNYFTSMNPRDSSHESYHLYSLDQPSQRLVYLQGDNNLYFSKNAGKNTITRKFKELMDSISNQTYSILPDEINMTFEYNNELYSQLNESILSSEDIKEFIYNTSGVILSPGSVNGKPFSRMELLMILKQYVELPVHIRDNLALKKIVRVESVNSSQNIFGHYTSVERMITLADGAFENSDNQGEETFLHEIAHSLWGKSIWQGLSEEARKDYAQLSWLGNVRKNDEFISDYSATNISEDFAEHFSSYINEGEILKHEVKIKYDWFKEHIFINAEYITNAADHLKIFVESENGDVNPPYLLKFPSESFNLNFKIKDAMNHDPFNGYADIRVEVSGLFDDRSKIKKIAILMESEQDHFWVHSPVGFNFCETTDLDKVPNNCVLIDPSKPGWYAYHNSQRTALTYSGEYKMTQVRLEDEAGNKVTLRSNFGDAVIPFPGTRGLVEEEQRRKAAAARAAQRKKKAEEEEARRKMEVAKEAERNRKEIEEEKVQREKVAKEIEGFNILNLSEDFVTIYKDDRELTTLGFAECLSITEQELSLLSLETSTGWLDWKFDAQVCSNIDDSVNNCEVRSTSLLKQNNNRDYFLSDYQGEFEADFRNCKPSEGKILEKENKERSKNQVKQKKEIEEEKVQREKVAKEIEGFNILNLSEDFVTIYKDDRELTTLGFAECLSITEQELSLLSLETSTGWLDWKFDAQVCSNIDDSVNNCEVRSTSLVKQNNNRDYFLSDYQGEFEADFRNCIYSKAKKEEIEAEEAEEAEKVRLKKAAEEAVGLNIVNLSERPIRIYQNQEALFDLEPKKCVSINESELLQLSLKRVNIPFDERSFICTNIKNNLGIRKCDVTKNSLLKQNEDGKYRLTNYQNGDGADFSACRSLTMDKESSEEDSFIKEEPALPPERDKTSPYFVDSGSISVSLEEYNERYAFFKVEANGLFDEMSEIEDIDVFLRSENGYLNILSPTRICTLTPENMKLYKEKCLFIESDKPGRYVYYKALNLNDYFPGDYKINSVRLGDASGNHNSLYLINHPVIFIPGKKLLVTRADLRQMKKDLEIRSSKTVDGDTLIHVLTTDMRNFKLHDVNVSIIDMETGQELQYLINTNKLSSLNAQFKSPNISNKMSLPIVIPKELTKGSYRLNWIAFETKEQNTDYYYARFDASDPDTYFNHISDEEDIIAQPVVDDIVMNVIKGPNRKGGDTSIKIDIPITDLDEGNGFVKVTMRTPTGEKFSFDASLWSNPRDGSRHLEALLQLKPRHAEGEYMITHIYTVEDYTNVFNNSINHDGLRLVRGARREKKTNLLERTIKTTLSVSAPPPQEPVKY